MLVPMPPAFSVVLATYNRADRIARAIDSVFAQTDADWELIVIDDGSTDATEAVVAPFTRDRRVVWISRPHAGVWPAKNAGAALARGRWITFLDSDDAFTPTHLAERRAFIAANPGARFVHGGALVLGPPELQVVPDADDPTRLVPLSECVLGATFVVEQRLWHELGGFPEDHWAADRELFRRAEARGGVVRCEAPTYLYIREPGVGVCEEMRLRAMPRTPTPPLGD
jgi:glycosyltransferase involved in cell wall biosynthesis